MTWTVEIRKPALKQLEKITDMRIREKLLNRIEELESNPNMQGKALKGELSGLRSVKAVNQRYRIIYRLEQERITVLVVAVGLRKEGDRTDVYLAAERILRTTRRFS